MKGIVALRCHETSAALLAACASLWPWGTALAGPPSADLPNGTYTIMAPFSGKCVEAAGAGKTNGTNVDQSTCNGTRAQMFKVVSTGGGYYKLQNVNSGLVLDVTGSSTVDGGNIDLWQDFAAANQRFSIQRLNGNLFTVANQNSSKCMDIVGGFTSDGANVQQWTCNGSAQQHFQFIPVSVSGGGTRLPVGRYTLVSQNSGKCLDVTASGTPAATQIPPVVATSKSPT